MKIIGLDGHSDYVGSHVPYRTPTGGARRFLEDAELAQANRIAIAHRNWERLVDDIRRE